MASMTLAEWFKQAHERGVSRKILDDVVDPEIAERARAEEEEPDAK